MPVFTAEIDVQFVINYSNPNRTRIINAVTVWMALNPVDLYWGWIGAVVIMSLAEAILFPSMNVHIDRIAPNHLRGAYFGATTFYSLGFAFAPLGGGILLDHLSGSWLFFISAILCLAVIYLYSILNKLPRDKITTIE